MNNNQLLKQLKQLKIDDIKKSFSTHKEWNDWADNVAPLLKYNPDHYSSFMNSLQYIRIETLSAATIVPHLYNMTGIVKQAIIELESNIDPHRKTENFKLEYPQKVTLKWIWEHVPAKYYWSFFLILFFAFSLGIAFSQTNLYKSLTDLATAIIKTNKTIDKTIQ